MRTIEITSLKCKLKISSNNTQHISILFIVSVITVIVLIIFESTIRLDKANNILEFVFNKDLMSVITINIKKMNSYLFTSSSILSLFISEVVRRYTSSLNSKELGINYRPYARYCIQYVKIAIILLGILIAFLLDCAFSLFIISIGLMVYLGKIILYNDYTFEIKNGVKYGYFKDVIKLNDNKEAFTWENYANESLMESMIVYSLKYGNQGHIDKNYEILNFSSEILECFYVNYLNSNNIELYITELKKSLEAFFIYRGKNIYGFFYYINRINKILEYDYGEGKLSFKKIKSDNLCHRELDYLDNFDFNNLAIYCSLICIVSRLELNKSGPYTRDNVLELIYQRIDIQLYELQPILANSLYIISMWQLFMNARDKNIIECYINFWQNKIVVNSKKNTSYQLIVYKICLLILTQVYNYSNKNIRSFNANFIFMYQFISSSIYESYLRFLREVI